MSAANIQRVKDLYAIHAAGDFEGVIAACTPDVEFHSGGDAPEIPGFLSAFRPRKGHEEVREFFRLVSESLEFQEYTALEFYSDQDKVFVLGRCAFTIKPTGQKGKSDWAHIITLRDGKIATFREFFDTETVATAFRAA